jgi:hypothetical protein
MPIVGEAVELVAVVPCGMTASMASSRSSLRFLNLTAAIEARRAVTPGRESS